MRGTPEERFWDKVHKTDGCWPYDCWLWSGETVGRGDDMYLYGRLLIDGQRVMAHRFSYELAYGPIPDLGLVDHRHTCPKTCVNPDHLRVLPHKQNAENRVGARTGSKSGIWGVSWAKKVNCWCARVCHNGRSYWGGYHDTLEEAEAAAVALRNKLFTHNDADRIQTVV